ncbi:MAG: Uma2 family endonuclease [Myxococcota bacterium]
MEPAKQHATYQDVLDAPANMRAELIDGELYLQPRPAYPHAEAASVLGMLLGPPFRLGRGGPGGWWIVDEPELHLGSGIYVPDLAGWRREEGSELDRRAAYQTTPPHWLCEVLSPSTRRIDRLKKVPRYGEAGVAWLWIVDPESRTIEVFAQHEGSWRLEVTHDGTGEASLPPFEDVAIAVGEMWVDGENPDPP